MALGKVAINCSEEPKPLQVSNSNIDNILDVYTRWNFDVLPFGWIGTEVSLDCRLKNGDYARFWPHSYYPIKGFF